MDKIINQLLLDAKVSITNTLEQQSISTPMAEFGYTAEIVQHGQELLLKATSENAAFEKEYGEQMQATANLHLAWSTTTRIYMRHLKVARIALKGNDEAAKALVLTGRRKRSYTGLLGQMKAFYKNLLISPKFLEAMNTFGQSREILEANNNNVNDTEAKLAAQAKETGEAQAARIRRDNAVDELDEWYSDFIAIARIALEEYPQYLEILGIKEPSE